MLFHIWGGLPPPQNQTLYAKVRLFVTVEGPLNWNKIFLNTVVGNIGYSVFCSGIRYSVCSRLFGSNWLKSRLDLQKGAGIFDFQLNELLQSLFDHPSHKKVYLKNGQLA